MIKLAFCVLSADLEILQNNFVARIYFVISHTLDRVSKYSVYLVIFVRHYDTDTIYMPDLVTVQHR